MEQMRQGAQQQRQQQQKQRKAEQERRHCAPLPDPVGRQCA
ncbi:hypothetical protein GSbR_12260 [Geobacter sp. SVR]|nr:hypothetical protein GSVR_15490 [Geobacter sp. SVR]GCF84626.1 hypothetical protein GSbR_12260 [Geobacter sp. SVR]